MPRITSDPGRDTIPDHAQADYDPIRDALVQSQVAADDDAAIRFLDNTWEASTARRKALWVIQEEEDAIAIQEELEQERQRIADEARDHIAELDAKRPKAIPVDRTRQIGDSIIHRPSSYALNLLDKSELCPLWYFTEAGLNEAAQKASQNTSEDVFGFSKTENGIVMKSVNSSSASPNVVLDKNLEWRDFSIAQAALVNQMAAARWPTDRIQMTREFFTNINLHPVRSLRGGKGDQILLAYQAAARQQWHDDLKHGTCWDLSAINPTLLQGFKTEVLDEFEYLKSVAVRVCPLKIKDNSLTNTFLPPPRSHYTQ